MANAAKNVMLAETWNEDIDPTGWWMSEKLDGVRAYWNGKHFFSRLGHMYSAPKWFTEALPKEPLDGELWCGRGLFQKCVGIVKRQKNAVEDDWKFVTYLVFDAPSYDGNYEERVNWLRKSIPVEKQNCYAAVVGIKKCQGKDHLLKQLQEIIDVGGEGLMLRKPGSKYSNGRSPNLLKVKQFYDEEAKVTGYKKGEGRVSGMMGALECVLTNGVQVTIGTGFNDAQRKKPPKKGSVITFKYQELSDKGHPRFPVFLRERKDLTWEEVLELAKTKTPFSCKPKPVRALKKQHTILFSTVPSRDQVTGKKVITDDDILDDDDEENEGETKDKSKGKKECKWGKNCYQTNPSHLAKFSHPPKSSADDTSATAKVPCKWGNLCYLTSEKHLSQYSHPSKKSVPVAPAAEDEDTYERKGKGKEEDDEEEREATIPISSDTTTTKDNDDDLLEEKDLESDEELISISRKEWISTQQTLQELTTRLLQLEKTSSIKRGADSSSSSSSSKRTRT